MQYIHIEYKSEYIRIGPNLIGAHECCAITDLSPPLRDNFMEEICGSSVKRNNEIMKLLTLTADIRLR